MIKNEILKIQHALKKKMDYESVLNISVETNIPIAPPIPASISITSRCNSDCVYCSFRTSLSKEKVDIPSEKIKQIINDLSVIGVKVLTFTGVEPLLRRDIEELCSYAQAKSMTVHITTNGLLLTRNTCYTLNNCGVRSIVISLDSIDDIVYKKHRGVSNKKVIQALDALTYYANLDPHNYGVVTVVISKSNYADLHLFVEHINQINKKILINFQPYHRPPDKNSIPQIVYDNASSEELDIFKALQDAEKELSPKEEDRDGLLKSINKLIEMKKSGYPINNSILYLKSIPDFLISNKLPSDLGCKAGYSGIYIQENLNMLPCWRLPAIGNLQTSNAIDLWFSDAYSKVRDEMVNHNCPKCMFLCHNETGWYDWYNNFFKENV